MNRLVIIGNGFDLAHGLPTKYSDFIDDFWLNLEKEIEDNLIIKDIIIKSEFYDLPLRYGDNQVKNYNDFKTNLLKLARERNYAIDKTLRCSTSDDRGRPVTIFGFKNYFFYHLCERKNIQNWVDVENEYYDILKGKAIPEKVKCDYPNSVSKLNEEFEQVKNLLEKYLSKIDKIQITNDSILKHFELIKINEEKYLTEFPNQDRRELEDFQNKYISERVKGKEITTYCLNFNYTQTINKYIDASLKEGEYRKYGIINNLHIHGRLNDKNNKINFGFGDEMDDDYKSIENLNDNEFLKNFKSFQYLQNSNYRDLLDYVDSGKFQVFVMGHSCGLSDRTLLNTIFEHNNCRSIKVFYHQRGDGTDNYTEIIQNISRHFNKKKLMREKIVNKTLCKPLPQIQLPKK